MRERRQYHRFGRRNFIANSAVTLIGFAAFALMLLNWIVDWIRGIAMIVFIATIVILIAMDFYRFRHFHCPKCGALLSKPDNRDLDSGDPIVFICMTCDIEWETGLSIPSS